LKQPSSMKTAVQLARQDIRMKEATLKSAKDATSKQIKAIRSIVDDIKPVEIRIKATKAAIQTQKKQADSSWTTFKSAVKTKHATKTLQSLNLHITRIQKMIAHKENMYKQELEISTILTKASNQLKKV